LNKEDNEPYPTQQEPSWETDVAWARKIGVLMGLVLNNTRNAWGLTRQGKATFEALLKHGANGDIDGHKCFLWSNAFKRQFDFDYTP
jgi:hypothetical protein